MEIKAYDENILVSVIRNEKSAIPFCQLREGDIVLTNAGQYFVCAENAHHSGDASYDGWIVHDKHDNGLFPEDCVEASAEKDVKEYPDAVFMQLRTDHGINIQQINRIFDLLGLPLATRSTEEVAFMEVDGDCFYAQGVMLDEAFAAIDYDSSPKTEYYQQVQAVLNDAELETEDNMYNFCGIRTMIVYPEN